MADAADLPAAERIAALDAFAEALPEPGAARAALCGAAAERIAPAVDHAGERALLGRLGECFSALDGSPALVRAETLGVLGHIVRGQRLDVARFGAADEASPAQLATRADLDEYTYLVAGCVGEFWTRLCLAAEPGYAALPDAEMAALGRRFGMGLQLVNILRDIPKDRAIGRCYLPAEDADPGDRAALFAAAQRWEERCAEHLAAAGQYVEAVRPRRLRFAAALPVLLGQATMAKWRAAGESVLDSPVKIDRAAVRRTLALTAIACLRDLPLRGIQ